jgi:predicted permease
VREVRQAFRSVLQKLAFAVTAILTIALGLGANVAVYAVVHAILLEPLPFRQPKELVQVWETHPELHNLQISVPDYLDWKGAAKSLDLAAYTFQSMDKATLLGEGVPTAVQGTNASPALFSMLGIKPIIGHVFSKREEKQPVILISEQLWRRKLLADPHVVGRLLRLDSTSFTVVGVLPKESCFPSWADVWMPLSLIDPELYSTRKYHPLEVVGRLRPGVSVFQAEIEMEKIAHELSAANPATNEKIGAYVVPLLESAIGDVKPPLIATWIAVGLVLLIACANLAHLMMSRALNRQHEIALRLALGASRASASRRFLLEAMLLSLGGGLLGLVVAHLILPGIRHLAHGEIPRVDEIDINFSVLMFGTLASCVMALLFFTPSYVQVFDSELSSIISSGATRTSSARRSWLSQALMVSEVALALAVVLSATTLLRSLSLTLETKPGFNPEKVICVRSPLVAGDWKKSYTFFRNDVSPALAAFPAIRDTAAVNAVPMSLGTTEHSRFATRFGIVGRNFGAGRYPTAQIRWCTPNYFGVLEIPLVRGRLLASTDYGQPRYLINQTLAQRFFPNSNPVGRKLLLGVVSSHPESDEIVGVVGDVREFGLTIPPEPTMYSVGVSPEMDLVLKTRGQSTAVDEYISRTMRRINPQAAIGPIRPLTALISASLARQRFIVTLIGAFAGTGICLCVIGIYGVFSYSVARRMREFGIRAAVGAQRNDLMSQVVRECLMVILPGLLAGIGISLGCSRFMRTLPYEVSPVDARSVIIAVVSLLIGCTTSVLIPSWRAAQADPARTLREQ